jgi:GT2 family glycosyltransferase
LKPNKITIIISVYKNTKALSIILKALENQTVLPDEIIISEDCQSPEMNSLLKTINNDKITHLTQDDIGWRKNQALNKAIVKASGDYLIFIDGDVVPHSHFIEGHLYHSDPKIICSGKRVALGEQYSQKIYDGKLSIEEISDSYFKNIIALHKDNIKHYEDGIYSHFLNKLTLSRYVRHIIGCNFSCYKTAMLDINGFNEDFIRPAIGEDVDISWRFRGLGYKLKSCRYIANQFHLWHKKGFFDEDMKINTKIMVDNMDKKEYICKNGIKKL